MEVQNTYKSLVSSLKSFFGRGINKRVASALVIAPITLYAIFRGDWAFLVFILLIASVCLWEWFSLGRKTPSPGSTIFLGFLYIPSAMLCLYLIRIEEGLALSLLFVFMIWASDTFAYIFGKFFKGPKMAPVLSPNKTWSGLGGAVAGPVAVSLIFFVVTNYAGFDFDLFLLSLIMGIVIGMAGQAGDLGISFLKRKAGAKDSGTIMPGHGGLLDRMDSMLLCGPVYLLLIEEFSHVIA